MRSGRTRRRWITSIRLRSRAIEDRGSRIEDDDKKPAGRVAPRVSCSAEAEAHLASINTLQYSARRVKCDGEGVPEVGFEPTCRFRHTIARCARLPVPPFGHVRENVRNRVRPQQITSRSLVGTIVLIGGASVTNRLPTGASSCRYRKSVNCVMGAAPAEPSYDPLSNTPIWCTDEEKREGAVRHQELG